MHSSSINTITKKWEQPTPNSIKQLSTGCCTTDITFVIIPSPTDKQVIAGILGYGVFKWQYNKRVVAPRRVREERLREAELQSVD